MRPHTATLPAAVADQGTQQGSDLRQRQVGALREHADAVVDPLAENDAGDVVAAAVDGGGIWDDGGFDGVVQDFRDGFGVAVGEVAVEGPAAVEAKATGMRGWEENVCEEEEAGDKGMGIHGNWGKFFLWGRGRGGRGKNLDRD